MDFEIVRPSLIACWHPVNIHIFVFLCYQLCCNFYLMLCLHFIPRKHFRSHNDGIVHLLKLNWTSLFRVPCADWQDNGLFTRTMFSECRMRQPHPKIGIILILCGVGCGCRIRHSEKHCSCKQTLNLLIDQTNVIKACFSRYFLSPDGNVAE
jgi:hypothetical protein